MDEVTKTPSMLEIETRFDGRDIRDLISEFYGEYGNLREVALRLGCSHSLVWDVVSRFRGTYDRALTFPGREPAGVA